MTKESRDTLSFGPTDNPYLQQKPQEDLDLNRKKDPKKGTSHRKDKAPINKT